MAHDLFLSDDDLTFHSVHEYDHQDNQAINEHFFSDDETTKDTSPYDHNSCDDNYYHYGPEGGMEIEPPDLGIIVQGPLEPLTLEEITALSPAVKETRFKDYSTHYIPKIQSMPERLNGNDLSEIISFLQYAPLLDALHLLGSTLSDPTQTISNQKRESVQRLIDKHTMAVTQGTTAHTILHTPYDHLSIELFDPLRGTADDLDELLGKAHACTYSKYKEKRGPVSPAHLYFEDAKRGGSIHYIVERDAKSVFSIDFNYHQKVEHSGYIYTRLYLAVDSDDEPFLFIDCVEAGNITWQNVEDYIEHEYQDGLLGSIATALLIAQAIGIDRVATGDDEAVAFARMVGQTEKRFFQADSTTTEQKIGLKGSDKYTTGTYLWRLDSSDTFYSFSASRYRPSQFDVIDEQCRAIQERLRQRPKSVRSMETDLKVFQNLLTKIEPLAQSYNRTYGNFQF